MEMARSHDDAYEPAAPHSGAAEVFRALASLIAESSADRDLATRAVDRVVDLMHLSTATLSSVHEDAGGVQLEAVASVGAHAAFTRDISARPLESLADAAKVVEEGHAVYRADEHDAAGSATPVTGVARWRSNVSARASGVLPVRSHGETVGVLTVEWPHSQPPSQDERDTLQAAAAILGTILHEMRREVRSSEPLAPLGPEAAVEAQECDTLPAEPLVATSIRGVMSSGAVVSLPGIIPPHIAPVAVISAATSQSAGCGLPVAEVIKSPGGAVGVIAAVVTTSGKGAHVSAGPLREALAGFLHQSVGPAEALGYLEHELPAAAPGAADARMSAVVSSLVITGGQAVCTLSAAGAGLWVFRSRDGRTSVRSPDRGVLGLGAARHVEDRYELLLPGDKLALVCGPVGSPDGVERAVCETFEPRGADELGAARAVLTALGGQTRSMSVVIVDVRSPD